MRKRHAQQFKIELYIYSINIDIVKMAGFDISNCENNSSKLWSQWPHEYYYLDSPLYGLGFVS